MSSNQQPPNLLNLDGYTNKKGVFEDLSDHVGANGTYKGDAVYEVCRYNGKFGVINRKTKTLEVDYIDSFKQAKAMCGAIIDQEIDKEMDFIAAKEHYETAGNVLGGDVVMPLSEFKEMQAALLACEEAKLEHDSRAKVFQKARYCPIPLQDGEVIPTDVNVVMLERNASGGYLVMFDKPLCAEHLGTPIYINLDKQPTSSKIQRFAYAILKYHLDCVIDNHVLALKAHAAA